MASAYQSYYLDNSKNTSKQNATGVLKKDFTLDVTDYEKLKIAEQYNKLYTNIFETNKENEKLKENKKIFNMSIKELINKSGQVYISLINDLSIFFSDGEEYININKLGLILTKEDNLLYIGILILIIAFFLWIIQITT
jgi:hypothetical protein